MSAILPTHLTVDEFLRWSMDQARGRYELEGGRIVAMQAENARHTNTKRRAYEALGAAIKAAAAPFYAMPGGPTVRISDDRAYEPDALVAPLPEVDGDALEIPNPLVVVEVLSPTPNSFRRDMVTKLANYAGVPSIMHYIVIDPKERVITHFNRDGHLLVLLRQMDEAGTLVLDPPGLTVAAADMLEREAERREQPATRPG